jgi:hypothetical protein
MRIFFGAPFTKYVNKKTGKVVKSKREFIEKMIFFLEEKGHYVRNAHSREKFGKDLMPAHVCTKLDLEEIRACDLFIAMPGNPPSGGVHVELGWASVLDKKIILLLRKKGKYSPLIHGLGTVGNVETIVFGDEKEIFENLGRMI